MSQSNVRHLRRVTPPLASYLRVGHRDAALVAELLDVGLPVGAGVIVDPAATKRTADLRHVARQHALEIILDPRSVELSTIGGLASSTAQRLPWAPSEPHTPAALAGPIGQQMASEITTSALEENATAVLAPSHFLDDDIQWLAVDEALTQALRDELDAAGGTATAVYYPLVASQRFLRNEPVMTATLASLKRLVRDGCIDAVFLRLHGFGTASAGSQTLRTYIRLARRLHDLGVPVVAERSGTVGVALAAFGAVGGIESSITYGETCDVRRLLRPPRGKGFVPPPRVYMRDALSLVSKAEAESVLDRRGFSRMRCQEACCRSDRSGMVADPRRHFVVNRSLEMSRLSLVPEVERAGHYVTGTLLPASNQAARLARTFESMSGHHGRLLSWAEALNRTLEEDAAANEAQTRSAAPTGHRHRQGA